jgi:hypothetical protein
MKREAILIALCVAAFIAIANLGVQFINNPVEDFAKEGFKTGAVTRASDCNCLPGYIPSNKGGGGYDGNIITDPNGAVALYIPNNTKDMYMIDTNNTCNLLPGVNNFDMRTSTDDNNYAKYRSFISSIYEKSKSFNLSSYNYKGNLQCDLVKQGGSDTNYFCQNLETPSKTRKCY